MQKFTHLSRMLLIMFMFEEGLHDVGSVNGYNFLCRLAIQDRLRVTTVTTIVRVGDSFRTEPIWTAFDNHQQDHEDQDGADGTL